MVSPIKNWQAIAKSLETKKASTVKLRLHFADRTGLEPATSAVTGRHSNQLNYRSVFSKRNLFRFVIVPKGMPFWRHKYSVFNLFYNKYFKIIATRSKTAALFKTLSLPINKMFAHRLALIPDQGSHLPYV